jgi:hypothetical protein
MSPRSLAIALLAAGLSGLGAQTRFLEPATQQALAAAGELRGSLSSGASPKLLPLLPRRAQILQEVRDHRLTVGVEVLAVFEGPGAALDTPEALRELYNLMHAMSGMKGLEYYSASRRRMRTLFTESYAIDDPVNRRPIPDRVFRGEIPAEDLSYLYQEDLTFGGTVYRVECFFEDGVLSLKTSNLTPMRYLGIPMIREGEALTWLCLAPFGGTVLFYGLTGGKTISFLGLEKSRSREDSFYYRLKALYGWYTRALGR